MSGMQIPSTRGESWPEPPGRVWEESLRGVLRDPPVGEDRSTGGRGMQEENGGGRTETDFTAEDAEIAEKKGRGNGDKGIGPGKGKGQRSSRRRKNVAGEWGAGEWEPEREKEEEVKQNDGGRMMKMGNAEGEGEGKHAVAAGAADGAARRGA